MSPKEITDALLRLVEILTAWQVVLLLILLLFRNQLQLLLPELLKRIKSAEIAGQKAEFFETKTIQTALGTTEVSAVSSAASTDLPDGFSQIFISQLYNFQITWPATNWVGDIPDEAQMKAALKNSALAIELSPLQKFAVVIHRAEPIGNFFPNVNVLVEPARQKDIRQYLRENIQQFDALGWKIESSHVDEDTQGALLVYYNSSFGQNLLQVSRLVLALGKAYNITASQLPPADQLSQSVRDEMVGILNSFRIITAWQPPRAAVKL